MEENVFYKPGEPSSVMSLNEEVDLFASCVNIYTTETDVYGDIMDEPRELEVFDEGAWELNLATGIVATLGLAACAIAVVATGGAAVGALTGVGIMYAGPALTVAGEQAGFEASFLMGTNALTVSTIPDIVTAGGMTLLATDGAYVLNEINTMCTGQNLAVDTVFEGNEENYEACVVALQVLNEGLLDLTTRGYQRNGSGSSSSEAEKSDEGAEISESGVNIRGAGDEGRISAKGLIGHDFEDYLSKTIGGEGSFSVGGRDFDGGIGNRWWEAKSGNYWSMLEENPNKLAKFKSDMGDRLRIATENGATYEIFSNTPIPESIKQWLTKKGIAFTELLD